MTHVEKAVCQRQEELGLLTLKVDYNRVEWHRVTFDAPYRRPPFKDGETEKGFRDSIIVECFLQLVANSPKTPKACRIVLVSGDALVAQAVKARTAGSTNTAVLSTLEELKGLINTLVSEVDEAFLASLKAKAEKLFFIPKEESTLLYKEHIIDKLKEKFAAELAATPPGATIRKNGTWTINRPNFAKKTGQRIQWTSRIEVEAEASKIVSQAPVVESASPQTTPEMNVLSPTPTWLLGSGVGSVPLSSLANLMNPTVQGISFLPLSAGRTVTTHKGVDVYEVLWSVDVTTARELRRPSIDEIRHSEPTWEQVT
ncbi:MAG: hypothetical protein WBC04_08575 [Candidatus Acidiferrales bacterium]